MIVVVVVVVVIVVIIFVVFRNDIAAHCIMLYCIVGHIPKTVQVELPFGTRMTGCDPKTTTGSTFGHTRLRL